MYINSKIILGIVLVAASVYLTPVQFWMVLGCLVIFIFGFYLCLEGYGEARIKEHRENVSRDKDEAIRKAEDQLNGKKG